MSDLMYVSLASQTAFFHFYLWWRKYFLRVWRARLHVCGACRNNPEVWRDLGIILLGDKITPELDIIDENSRSNVITCCAAMFSLWLERQPKASWRQLIDALINVKLISLAEDIDRLLIPSEPKKFTTNINRSARYLYVVSQ